MGASRPSLSVHLRRCTRPSSLRRTVTPHSKGSRAPGTWTLMNGLRTGPSQEPLCELGRITAAALPGESSNGTILSWVPSPICLGSVSPSPYKACPREGWDRPAQISEGTRDSTRKQEPCLGSIATLASGLDGLSEKKKEERIRLWGDSTEVGVRNRRSLRRLTRNVQMQGARDPEERGRTFESTERRRMSATPQVDASRQPATRFPWRRRQSGFGHEG